MNKPMITIGAIIIMCGATVVIAGCMIPQKQERKAVPAVKERDDKGRFIIPNCPVCGAHPIDRWTGFHCNSGHTFETKNEPINDHQRP